MEYLAKLYPSLDQRGALSGAYVPAIYLFYAIAFLFPKGPARVVGNLPLLLLAGIRPSLTAGSVGGDYNGGVPVFLLTAAYLDFLVLSPLESEDIHFIGPVTPDTGKHVGSDEDSCKTLWEKLKWILRLTTTARGIGWSWQVKGVPANPDTNLSRYAFVRKYLLGSVRSWIYKTLWLYGIGFCRQGRTSTNNMTLFFVLNSAIGWCGACWAYNGINAIYRFAAAVSVASGLCEQWEWPPMFGKLRDAWSVRQMWR